MDRRTQRPRSGTYVNREITKSRNEETIEKCERSRLSRFAQNEIDRARKAAPIGLLGFELFLSRFRQRIKLGLTAVFGTCPFRFDPALLFQAMQCRIQRPLLHLQHLVRNLLNAFGDRPAVLWLKGDCAHDQQIEGALHEIARFPHLQIIYKTIVDSQEVSSFLTHERRVVCGTSGTARHKMPVAPMRSRVPPFRLACAVRNEDTIVLQSRAGLTSKAALVIEFQLR